MRRTFFVPFLLIAFGCDGRYVLGDLHRTEGDSGTPGSGGSGDSGSDSGDSQAVGAGGSSMTGDAGPNEAGGETSTGLVISPSSVPNAILGAPYAVTFGANGGAPDYAFQVSSGTLPTGLSLDANGQLSGTPQEQGAFSFVVEVTDAVNTKASASFQIEVSRTRWLASTTFVSTVSTQTALSMVDLQYPQAEPVLIESQSAIPIGFSPDGHWYLYSSYRGPDQMNQYDVYLVNTAGDKPSQRQFVLTTFWWACEWAPDSSKVACFKDTDAPEGTTTKLVYFDTRQGVVGSELPVGSVPPRSAGATGKAERELMFVDGNTLVYSYGPNDFARVAWNGQTPGAPQLLGVGGGTISKQSPDGGRAFIKRTDPNYAQGDVLVDFRLGNVDVLDSKMTFSISDGFEVGFGSDPPATGDAGLGTYSYYSVNGISVKVVGQSPAESPVTLASYPQIAGHTVVRPKGDRVVAITVGDAGIVEHVVPGDYQGVNAIKIDPAEKWLYIGTAEVDEQNRPIEATIKHWLSRLGADVPAAAQLIGQGYSIYTASNVLFSPDSQRLVLHGYDAYPHTNLPIAFRLFDLKDPVQIKSYGIDLSLSWADTTWSPDSTYVSAIGGTPDMQTRPLFVVDALAPTETPRKIIECGPASPSGPICPILATFQP
jgi:hypothetical protein